MTPNPCPQCGLTFTKANGTIQRKWLESGTTLCPGCISRWMAPIASKPAGTPRCGGCGRGSTSLHNGACPKCQANGVEALSLFDGAA